MTRIRLAVLTLAILAGLSTTAASQDAPERTACSTRAMPVAVQSAVRVRFEGDSSCARIPDGGTLHQDFVIQLAPDRPVRISVESPDFDVMVRVGRMRRFIYTTLAADDNSGGGTNAWLSYSPSEAGEYVVRVQPAQGQDIDGDFTLRISPAQRSAESAPRAIALDQAAQGTFSRTGMRDARDFPTESFLVRTTAANTRIAVEVTADGFDPVVVLEPVDRTQAARPGAARRIRTTQQVKYYQLLRVPGEYRLIVSAMSASAEGTYSLSVRRLPEPGAQPRPTIIRGGQPQSGTLVLRNAQGTSPMIEEREGGVGFRPYAIYRLNGRAGATGVVRLSGEFDTYLEMGALTPSGFAVSAANDDISPGSDLNSALAYSFASDGYLDFRVSPIVSGYEGAYTISVETGQDAAPPESPPERLAGFDVDVFYCAGPTGAANRERGQAIVGALAQADNLGGAAVGRVRLRELTEDVNSRAGYRIEVDEVRAESGERPFANAMMEHVHSTSAIRLALGGAPTTETPGYVSVFTCGVVARAR